MKLSTALIITWTALAAADATATADGQQPRDLDLQESRYKVKAKPEPYKPPQPAPNLDEFHLHGAQVLFPARTTPFTTTTSRSKVQDSKLIRRGKEAVPARSKEISKKKYRRLRKVKKRRRRKKDRTTPQPATTRRPILPLFDHEEEEDDDDQRALKKERAASRLEPSRTTPFRYYTPTKKPTTRYAPSPTPFGPHLPPDRRKKQSYKPPKPKYSRPTATTKAPYVPAVYEPEPYEELEPLYEPVKLIYKEPTPKPAYIPEPSYSPKPSYSPRPAYTPKPTYSLKPSYTPKPAYTPKPYKPKPEKPQAYYPSKPKPKLAPRLPTPKPAYIPSPKPSYRSTAYTPSPAPAYSPSPKASRYQTPDHPEYSLTPEPDYQPSAQPAYRSTPSPTPRYHSTPKPSYRSTTPLYEPAALHSSLEPTYHSTPTPAYRSTHEPSPSYNPPVKPAYHHPPPPPPPSPKPSYPTTPVFIPHEPPSIVSHAPGLVDEYLLGDYDDYEKKPYSFTYGVRDERSGADFEQNEETSSGVTRGSYKVALPDGRTQIVTYTADDVHGFKAEVTYEGEASYPKPSEYSGPGLRPNFVPAATLQGRDHHRPPPLELVDFPPVLSHPSPLQAPHGGPFRLPKHFNLDHFGLSAADVAESVRDEVEIRHSGNRIPKFVPPPPPPPPTASPFTFTTAASPTTPYYTTVTPYDRPERHRPPSRRPSPPAYRPVRHKRQKSKETEFELSDVVDYSDDDPKEKRGEEGTGGVRRLPTFDNFEPSPDDSKPDGTKALAGKKTRSSQSQETTPSKRKKKYFGPYSPSAPRRSKSSGKKSKSPASSSSIESPAQKFTNFVGPYAESAYIRPTTYRPSKEFIQKLKSKRNAAKSKSK